VLGFELLEKIHVVIDQGESSGLTASEVSAESKTRDDISCSLVHLGQFLGNLLLGDCGASRMENIHNHLSSGQKPVGHELAGSDGSRNVSHVWSRVLEGDW